MRTQQITITFPRKKTELKEELMKMKNEENLNISSFMVSLLEKELGYVLHNAQTNA
ncbi:MAG: hypothetical protein VW580_00925 [Flavobacteriaceae bacterium]